MMRVTLVSLCFVVVGCVTSCPDIGEARMSPSLTQPTLQFDTFREGSALERRR